MKTINIIQKLNESFDTVQYWGSKNKYGYTIRQLKVDYNNKTYAIGSFKQSVDHEVTNKEIDRKIEELKAMGFKEETNESYLEVPDRYEVRKNDSGSYCVFDTKYNTCVLEGPLKFVQNKCSELNMEIRDKIRKSGITEADEIQVYSNAESEDESDARSRVDTYSKEAPNLKFSVHKEGCSPKKLKEDSLVWSNTGSSDYYNNLTREEMIQEIKDNGWEEEEINGESILDADDDTLRDWLTPRDIDLDYEDYVNSIEPMIEEQCFGDVIVLSGTAANWRGKGSACKAIKTKDLSNYLMPDYEASIKIYCDNNDNLYYTEANHDTPMGGTEMYLYSFHDKTDYNNAEKKLQELFDDEDFSMYYFCDWVGCDEVDALIDAGLLKNVKRNH